VSKTCGKHDDDNAGQHWEDDFVEAPTMVTPKDGASHTDRGNDEALRQGELNGPAPEVPRPRADRHVHDSRQQNDPTKQKNRGANK
jgi:hypothetical protein